MNPTTLRPRTQVALAILVPLCCLLTGVFAVWPAVSAWRRAGQELEATQTTITRKQKVIAQAEAVAQGRDLVLAVALPSEDEPITFLRGFAGLCRESGVTISSVRESTPPKTPGAATTPATPTPPPTAGGSPAQLGGPTPVTPTSVSELADQVTVEGTFRDLLSLLVRMEGFQRILSVNQCRVSGGQRTYPRLRMSFTLTRFVAKPLPSPEASAGSRGPSG